MPMHRERPDPSPEITSPSGPTAEDWQRLQGGMPEIWFTPKGNLKVVHAYTGWDDPQYGRPDGAIVDTERSKTTATVLLRIGDADITFPSFMVWSRHGGPCERTSRMQTGHSTYQRLDPTSPHYRQQLTDAGLVGPYGVRVIDGAFRLIPYPDRSA